MLQTKVTSSNIDSVAWENETLYITFKRGDTYKYDEVSLDVYNQMVEASSVGKFFIANVRDNFTATKVESVEA